MQEGSTARAGAAKDRRSVMQKARRPSGDRPARGRPIEEEAQGAVSGTPRTPAGETPARLVTPPGSAAQARVRNGARLFRSVPGRVTKRISILNMCRHARGNGVSTHVQ